MSETKDQIGTLALLGQYLDYVEYADAKIEKGEVPLNYNRWMGTEIRAAIRSLQDE